MKVCSHAASKVLRCFIFFPSFCVCLFFWGIFFFFSSLKMFFFFFRFHLFPNCKLVWLQFMDRTILFSSKFVFPNMKYSKCNIITSYEILNVTALHSAALQSLTNTLIHELILQTCAFCLGYTF